MARQPDPKQSASPLVDEQRHGASATGLERVDHLGGQIAGILERGCELVVHAFLARRRIDSGSELAGSVQRVLEVRQDVEVLVVQLVRLCGQRLEPRKGAGEIAPDSSERAVALTRVGTKTSSSQTSPIIARRVRSLSRRFSDWWQRQR